MVNMENMLSSNWSLHIYIPGLQRIQFKNTEKRMVCFVVLTNSEPYQNFQH